MGCSSSTNSALPPPEASKYRSKKDDLVLLIKLFTSGVPKEGMTHLESIGGEAYLQGLNVDFDRGINSYEVEERTKVFGSNKQSGQKDKAVIPVVVVMRDGAANKSL